MGATKLRCKECGDGLRRSRPATSASAASGPLEVAYEQRRRGRRAARRAHPGRPAEHLALRTTSCRSRARSRAPAPACPPGCTPLIRADRLAERLGLREVWVKNDAANPTHSFKDRVVSVAAARARELGFDVARLRLDGQPRQLGRRPRRRARAWSPTSSSPPTSRSRRSSRPASTARTSSRSAATTTTSTGSAPSSAGERDWAFVNVNLRPYYAEGSKTLAYEIAEQLGWEAARPRRGADRLGLAVHEDRQGLRRSGSSSASSTATLPTMNGAQAHGLLAGGHGLRGRASTSASRCKPDTIAKSLAIGNPADGPYALDLARAQRRRASTR